MSVFRVVENTRQSMLAYLECPECGRQFEADRLQTYCHDCRSPLLARYDLARLRGGITRQEISQRKGGVWRWAELLPVRQNAHRLTLGEGDTPLIPVPRIGKRLGIADLIVKDESINPTGTFKARGMAVAVGRAVELGVKAFVAPTAGNAGGALAVYAARAGAEAHVFMPGDAPLMNQQEVTVTGAALRLVKGLVNDASKQAAVEAEAAGWFDISTFKEPYQVEGKKTLGLELAEAFNWKLPDVIVCPTGEGSGMVGMWKAFKELEALGWLDSHLPRMVAVQAEGCAPVVRAFQAASRQVKPWENAHTMAAGLRAPAPFADRLILDTLYESHGVAVSVPDKEIATKQFELARLEGIFSSPEGAACLAALPGLVNNGWIKTRDSVVMVITGTGLKYL